jgi:hypothetical protein
MWMPNPSKLLKRADVALISRDYEDLLFYNYPILFTGLNNINDRILASFVENKEGVESYLHSIIDEKTYSSFINRKINYPQVLKEAHQLFLVHWTGEITPTVYWQNYEDIPDIYHPNELAFCPEIDVPPSFDFEAKFEGGLADKHQALPETVSKLQNKFADLLRIPLNLGVLSNLISRVLLQTHDSDEVHATGSLKIKYHVQLEEEAPTFFHDPDAYSRFLNRYLAYCLQNLSEDAPKLVGDGAEGLEKFEQLVNEYKSLAGQQLDFQEQKKREIADSVLESAKKLDDITSIVKDEFKQVVLSSLTESNAFPLGVLDEDFGQEIEVAIREVEIKTGKVPVIDEEPQPYKLHIYDLNTDTRKGKALMSNPDDTTQLMKFGFKISGTEALSKTRYTESMHLDKFIDVKGRATKTEGIVKYIEIEFEP